jgi:hypothetical protein
MTTNVFYSRLSLFPMKLFISSFCKAAYTRAQTSLRISTIFIIRSRRKVHLKSFISVGFPLISIASHLARQFHLFRLTSGIKSSNYPVHKTMKLQESLHLGNGSRMFFAENEIKLSGFSAFQSLMRFNPMQLSDFVEPLS